MEHACSFMCIHRHTHTGERGGGGGKEGGRRKCLFVFFKEFKAIREEAENSGKLEYINLSFTVLNKLPIFFHNSLEQH